MDVIPRPIPVIEQTEDVVKAMVHVVVTKHFSQLIETHFIDSPERSPALKTIDTICGNIFNQIEILVINHPQIQTSKDRFLQQILQSFYASIDEYKRSLVSIDWTAQQIFNYIEERNNHEYVDEQILILTKINTAEYRRWLRSQIPDYLHRNYHAKRKDLEQYEAIILNNFMNDLFSQGASNIDISYLKNNARQITNNSLASLEGEYIARMSRIDFDINKKIEQSVRVEIKSRITLIESLERTLKEKFQQLIRKMGSST